MKILISKTLLGVVLITLISMAAFAGPSQVSGDVGSANVMKRFRCKDFNNLGHKDSTLVFEANEAQLVFKNNETHFGACHVDAMKEASIKNFSLKKESIFTLSEDEALLVNTAGKIYARNVFVVGSSQPVKMYFTFNGHITEQQPGLLAMAVSGNFQGDCEMMNRNFTCQLDE